MKTYKKFLTLNSIQASSLSKQSSNYSFSTRKKMKLTQRMDSNIQNSLRKFIEINNEIEESSPQSKLNLIKFGGENLKLKYDPDVSAARLKSMENKLILSKAQVELGRRHNRKHKSLSSEKSKEFGQNYKQTYKKYVLNTEGSQNQKKYAHEITKVYEQNLRPEIQEHQHLMRYAVDKFKNKIKNSDKNKVLWKKNKNDLNSDYKELLEEQLKKVKKNSRKGERKIVNLKLQKIYNKRHRDSLNSGIQENERCKKMIIKQRKLMNGVQNCISSESRKQLEGKLNSIVIELSKSERISNNE